MRSTTRLRDALGQRIPVGPWTYGVNGRFTLTRDGVAVVPRGQTSLFMRNPRTFIGRTDAGQIGIVTIDGRQPSSVGASLRETAQVALALGLTNAINLDGGGSTTMVVNGALANSVSGSSERPVGDALAWSSTPYARGR
jgi:exopolysaccharide biosynthesis protein